MGTQQGDLIDTADVLKVGLVGVTVQDRPLLEAALVTADPAYGAWFRSRVQLVDQRYSSADLNGFVTAINNAIAAPGSETMDTYFVHVDSGANRVKLTADRQIPALTSRIAASLPADAFTIEVMEGLTFEPMENRFTTPLKAGKGIQVGAETCTSGFLFQRGLELVGTTAGHCSRTLGDPIVLGTQRVGTVAGNAFQASPTGIDVAWFSLTPAADARAEVTLSDRPSLPVKREFSVENLVDGETRTCFVGRFTSGKHSCGPLGFAPEALRYKIDGIVHILEGVICGTSWTRGAPTKGDSGAPAFRFVGVDGGVDNAAEAVGIFSGSLTFRGFPIAQCFTPISFVRAEYGMTLALG